ncbi:ribose 5-phosphate isomerase B [Chloroflexota bacterium]
MRIVVGADHGGLALKDELIKWLKKKHEVIDVGAVSFDRNDDYPDFAEKVASAVRSGIAQRGIIICGSGVGACVAANKILGIRACLCHDTYSAHQGVEHDDMNVLCLGARIIGSEIAMELVSSFLSACFLNEERYRRRLGKVLAIEKQNLQHHI